MRTDGPTTSYGYELTPGDDAGRDDVPVYCDTDLAGATTAEGGIDYRCGLCGTVVEINGSGLVFDIRLPVAA